MLIEFFKVTLGLMTISLMIFLIYSFLGGPGRKQASKKNKNKNYEQFREFEQELGDDGFDEDEFDVEESFDLESNQLDFNETEKSSNELDPISQSKIPDQEADLSQQQDSAGETFLSKENTTTEDNGEKNTSRIISVFILANVNQLFSGYDLLQALLSVGLRYGEMNIFHRHEEENGHGRVLFSLASATEPGTFDIQNMGKFSGKGLCMFMHIKGNNQDINTLELFIKTARRISDELNGSIYDSHQRPLTNETINQFHQTIHAARQESEPFELA